MREKKWIALYPIFYRVLFVILLSGVLMKGFGNFIGIRNIGGWHWAAMLVYVGLFVWFHHGKISEKIIAAVLFLLCVLVLITYVGAGKIDGFWENYYLWLVVGKGYDPQWITGYELMQVLWVVFGSYVFQVLSQKNRLVKDLSALLLVGALPVCMILQVKVDHIGVSLIIAYTVVCLLEHIRTKWGKVKSEDKRGYIIWLAPFCLAYLLILCYIPPKEEPYEWTFVRQTYQNIKEKVVTWFENTTRDGQEDFGTFLTGFSEETKIGGNVKKDNREIMTVQGGRSLVTTLYLAGKTYNTFTGREWKQDFSEDLKEHPLDALELLYAVKRYDENRMENYVLNSTVSLQYGRFDTGYLFVPLKTTFVKDVEYKIVGRDFTFGEQKGYGTSYSFLFYQMNQKTSGFKNMLHAKQAEAPEVWTDIASRYAPEGMKDLTLTDLQEYRQSMKETYSDEVVLSKRVEAYLHEVTKDCVTSYDRLVAIETELSQFAYNTNPGKLPKWVRSQEEFLDYFLLENRQGYCTYFATAFVLLARAEGLPARYVEGFFVPVNQSKEMRVTAGMAHAWPEVYIEGIGWLPFEPTPGYTNLRYVGWEVREVQADNSVEAKGELPAPSPSAEPPEDTEKKEETREFKWIPLLLFMGIALLIVIIMLFLEKMRQKRIYNRWTEEQKYVAEVRRNLWILEKIGYKRAESETLYELKKRIERENPDLFAAEQDWEFLNGYEEYLYRGEKADNGLLECTLSKREELLLWVKREDKKYYWWLKLLLYIFGY